LIVRRNESPLKKQHRREEDFAGKQKGHGTKICAMPEKIADLNYS
jgi:hypothetical protein